jgi:hypothetical protein
MSHEASTWVLMALCDPLCIETLVAASIHCTGKGYTVITWTSPISKMATSLTARLVATSMHLLSREPSRYGFKATRVPGPLDTTHQNYIIPESILCDRASDPPFGAEQEHKIEADPPSTSAFILFPYFQCFSLPPQSVLRTSPHFQNKSFPSETLAHFPQPAGDRRLSVT